MQDTDRLLQAVEEAVGRKMQTPKDFEFLSACIFQRLNETVSVSTLKRLWGYTTQYSSTRPTTLNLLARFVGFDSYEAFKETAISNDFSSNDDIISENVSATDRSSSISTSRKRRYSYILTAILVILAFIFFYRLIYTPTVGEGQEENSLTLVKGQSFTSADDYLRLFGITAIERFWDQALPHHPGIIVWSPLFQHPNWHNEGNPDSLLPTITEYWTPSGDSLHVVSPELIRQKNANLYFTVLRTNELRITFMRGLQDSAFIFLGIYRTDLQRSDSTHVVWQRIADECDLRNLDYLEQLRH